jgi:hypothetical protein
MTLQTSTDGHHDVIESTNIHHHSSMVDSM